MAEIYIFTEGTKLDDIPQFTNSECNIFTPEEFYPYVKYITLTSEKINDYQYKKHYINNIQEYEPYFTIHHNNIEVRESGTHYEEDELTYCKFEHFKELCSLISIAKIDLGSDFAQYKINGRIYTPINEL
jgi:hypothetical protein